MAYRKRLFCLLRDLCTLNISKGPFVKPTTLPLSPFVSSFPDFFPFPFFHFCFGACPNYRCMLRPSLAAVRGLYGTSSLLCGWPAAELETLNGLSSTGTDNECFLADVCRAMWTYHLLGFVKDNRCDRPDKKGKSQQGWTLARRTMLGPKSQCFVKRGSKETFRGGQEGSQLGWSRQEG